MVPKACYHKPMYHKPGQLLAHRDEDEAWYHATIWTIPTIPYVAEYHMEYHHMVWYSATSTRNRVVDVDNEGQQPLYSTLQCLQVSRITLNVSDRFLLLGSAGNTNALCMRWRELHSG